MNSTQTVSNVIYNSLNYVAMIYATVDSESTMKTRHALPSLPSCSEKNKQSIACHHHQVIHTDIGEI